MKVDYEKAKIDMLSYIKRHWRFFKDIDGKAYSDPYVYIAWKKKIIKWENNYSLANTYISKAELLTILTRLFKLNYLSIPVKVDDNKNMVSFKMMLFFILDAFTFRFSKSYKKAILINKKK